MDPERRAIRIARRKKIWAGIKKIVNNPVVKTAVETGFNSLVGSGKIDKTSLQRAAIDALGSTPKGSKVVEIGNKIRPLLKY